MSESPSAVWTGAGIVAMLGVAATSFAAGIAIQRRGVMAVVRVLPSPSVADATAWLVHSLYALGGICIAYVILLAALYVRDARKAARADEVLE